MSAMPSDQISGTSSTPPLLQRLKGTLSPTMRNAFAPTPRVNQQAAPQNLVSPPTPATPPTEPISDPTPPPVPPVPPPVPEEPPVELEQVAETVGEVAQEEVIQDELPPQVEDEAVTEQVMDDSATSVASAVPLAVESMTDTLNPPDVVGGGSAKESPLLSITVENPAVDQAGGVQYVESEKTPEMPPEVEGFLKKVEDNVDQIPQEIVISDQQSGQALPRVLAQPVVVLPISSRIEEEGKRKSADFSIRWLIEWSWKMMKTFSGKVVYRDEEATDTNA